MLLKGMMCGAAVGAVAGNLVYKDSDATFIEKTVAGAGAGAIIGAGVGGAISSFTPIGTGACVGMAAGGIAGIVESAVNGSGDPLSDLGTIAKDAAIGAGVGAAVGIGVTDLTESPASAALLNGAGSSGSGSAALAFLGSGGWEAGGTFETWVNKALDHYLNNRIPACRDACKLAAAAKLGTRAPQAEISALACKKFEEIERKALAIVHSDPKRVLR